MFKFENEIYLYLLLLIPVFIVLFILIQMWRKRAVKRFGDAQLFGRLIPDYSARRHQAKFLLYILAFAAIVIALANPQVGSKMQQVQRQGIDVVVAIDVSKSMLAEDLQPNRLERAKMIISRVIERMKDDRIAIIVFAGNAYLQMPLTIDYGAARQFLTIINTDMVPAQGTAIGEAIDLAITAFEDESKQNRALLVISDGENHEEGAIELAKQAKEEGIVVHTLGVGSTDGAVIPVFQNGRKAGQKQDKNGNLVVSKLNEQTLVEVAQAAGGQYFHIKGSANEVKDVLGVLDQVEKRDFEDYVITDYEDQFQYFIAFALLLLLIELLISERSTGWFKNWSLFGEQGTVKK